MLEQVAAELERALESAPGSVGAVTVDQRSRTALRESEVVDDEPVRRARRGKRLVRRRTEMAAGRDEIRLQAHAPVLVEDLGRGVTEVRWMVRHELDRRDQVGVLSKQPGSPCENDVIRPL